MNPRVAQHDWMNPAGLAASSGGAEHTSKIVGDAASCSPFIVQRPDHRHPLTEPLDRSNRNPMAVQIVDVDHVKVARANAVDGMPSTKMPPVVNRRQQREWIKTPLSLRANHTGSGRKTSSRLPEPEFSLYSHCWEVFKQFPRAAFSPSTVIGLTEQQNPHSSSGPVQKTLGVVIMGVRPESMLVPYPHPNGGPVRIS